MAASINDKLRQSTTSGTRPSPATLTAVKSIGASSISVDGTTGWATETATDFVIYEVDAAGAKVDGTQTEWIGIKNSSTSINNLTLKAGTDQEYAIGSKVIATPTAAWGDDLVEAMTAEHKQDGTHGDITADSITTSSLTISGVSNDGWTTTGGTHSVSTGYNSGNRSFEIATSTDISSFVSEGMRYRVTRNTTPPTQCADLEASSSHYASKASPTGITFTQTYTAEAWIKLESYTTARIVSRFNSTGWLFGVNSDGTLIIYGVGTGGTDDQRSYQSIPLNKWVHVAASINVNTNSYAIYIDGVSVPINSTSTACTAITQAGDLTVGAQHGGSNLMDGKLADVRVWSDIRTADEIRDNMYAYPSDTTGLVAHFKLNGDFTDASSNGNDLTAQNSAVATDADNPWNATEYGIITNVTSSTIQVFCPEGYGIPNETLTAPFYSTQYLPYGFPSKDKFGVGYSDSMTVVTTNTTTSTSYVETTDKVYATVFVGLNGKARISYSSSLKNSGVAFTQSTVYLDGSADSAASLIQSVNTNESTGCKTYISTTTPGWHTYAIYQKVTGGTGTFQHRTIVAESVDDGTLF